MTYPMTFDASHKVKLGGSQMRNLGRHIARDADEQAGHVFAHANKNIVPSRTHLNFTRVNDGNGGFRPLQSVDGRPPSQELEDAVGRNLRTVKRPLRKDAVVLRGLVVQMAPKWFEDNNPDWRTAGLNDEAARLSQAALDWVIQEFGQENVMLYSQHLDEHSPAWHVLILPRTPDGRLSQKDFFKGPADFRRQHKELREHMAAAGYDVEHRVTERSREHLSSSEFAAKADRLRAAEEEVALEQEAFENMQRGLRNRSANLDLRQAALAAKEDELALARNEAQEAAAAALTAQSAAQAAQHAARLVRSEAETLRDRLKSTLTRLEAIPSDVNRWLEKTKFDGFPMRQRFDDDMARARATRREVRQLIEVPDQKRGQRERELGD